MRKRTQEHSAPDRKKILYLIIGVCFLAYILIKGGIDISRSLFVHQPDRINLVVYGQYPMLYSFGVREAGNYSIPFYPDLKTQIPGGYGYYRIGALGKLTILENKPDLFLKTFSSISSTFVSYYFFDGKEDVYYGGKNEDRSSAKPKIKDIIFLKSNASIFDRLYLLSLLNKVQPGSFSSLSSLPYKVLKNDTILRNDTFLKKYIGVFYNKTYRDENLNIQILYSKNADYTTAEMISSLLNGSGIVVGDMTRVDNSSKRCVVLEQNKTHSKTAIGIASFFGCELKTGQTSVYDILFILGDLEKTWEVQS